MTTRTVKPGQNNHGRKRRIRQHEKNSWAGQPGQYNHGRKVRIRQQGKDSRDSTTMAWQDNMVR
jgi:hypothetical protein